MFKKMRIRAQVQYELERLLGGGSGGEVYSAWRFADEAAPKQKVAIKVVKASFDNRQLTQLYNEAKILSEIRSPHVVQIMGIEKMEQDRFALVMELVEGTNLTHWLKQGPQFNGEFNQNSELFWILGLHLLRGLHDLHSRQIVHGDLNPRNVLVNSQGVAKIVDFGLSSFHSNNKGTQLQGTRGYLSVRRLRGEPAVVEDDLFALGCMLYECLFATKLFPKNIHAQDIDSHIEANRHLCTDSVQVKLINELISARGMDVSLTRKLLRIFESQHLGFRYLPLFQREITETLYLDQPVTGRDGGRVLGMSRLLKNAAALTVFVVIYTTPSLTKTSVVIGNKKMGGAIINAKPWAHIYIDGYRVGESPAIISKLAPGFHRLDFLNGQKKKTVWFEVYPNSLARITHVF